MPTCGTTNQWQHYWRILLHFITLSSSSSSSSSRLLLLRIPPEAQTNNRVIILPIAHSAAGVVVHWLKTLSSAYVIGDVRNRSLKPPQKASMYRHLSLLRWIIPTRSDRSQQSILSTTNAYFTPPTRTRQNCLDLSCPCRRCERKWRQDKTVLSCRQFRSHRRLGEDKTVLSCPSRRCEIGLRIVKKSI